MGGAKGGAGVRVGRKEHWYPATEGLPQNRYVGLLTFKKAGSPSESVLSLTGPSGDVLTSPSFPAVDPAKQYRLRFGAVGDRWTIELFSLDELGVASVERNGVVREWWRSERRS